jgi:hypothetical protein
MLVEESSGLVRCHVFLPKNLAPTPRPCHDPDQCCVDDRRDTANFKRRSGIGESRGSSL